MVVRLLIILDDNGKANLKASYVVETTEEIPTDHSKSSCCSSERFLHLNGNSPDIKNVHMDYLYVFSLQQCTTC